MDLKLQQTNHNDLLNRIINGFYIIYIKGKKFYIHLPSYEIKYNAEKYYNNILEDLKYDTDWLEEDKRLSILNYYNIWNKDKENLLQTILKDLEKIKIQLFLNYSSEPTRNLIKQKIAESNEELSRMHHEKYTFFEYTKQSYATIMKNRYIIKNTVYYKNKLFFKSKNKYKSFYLNKLIGLTLNNTISHYEMRSLVQTEEWKSYWDAAKHRVFGKPIIKCNDEQRLAISMSQMIDNIRKHPNCPKDNIIHDADALDGWILYQNQEQEKQRKKAEIESLIKDKNAGEVFVMATNQEEIKEIMNLNDPQTRQDIRSMHKFARENKDKSIKWEDVPAIRDRIIRENKKS